MNNQNKKAFDCLLRARLNDFPEPTVHITSYGFQRAVCGVCGRHFQLSGYNRHYKQAHRDQKPDQNPRIRRHPKPKPARRNPQDVFDKIEPMGEWYWRKMSQESISRILASYPK